MRLMGESDESFKKRFTTERSRRFDFLQLEEAAFKIAGSGIFNKSEYQLKPSDGRNFNFSISEHKNAMSRLNDLMKRLKSHDATLFHPNGRTLKQGTEFPHGFNSGHMTNIEGKHLKRMKELEILEEKMQELKRTFKGIKSKYVTERRKGKENRCKANSSKRKRFITCNQALLFFFSPRFSRLSLEKKKQKQKNTGSQVKGELHFNLLE